MNHLILQVNNGWVHYRMGEQTGAHPIGDDQPIEVVAYLVKFIRPTSYEVHYNPEKYLETTID